MTTGSSELDVLRKLTSDLYARFALAVSKYLTLTPPARSRPPSFSASELAFVLTNAGYMVLERAMVRKQTMTIVALRLTNFVVVGVVFNRRLGRPTLIDSWSTGLVRIYDQANVCRRAEDQHGADRVSAVVKCYINGL